jgi:hypothetical protein
MEDTKDIEYYPLTTSRWKDLELLFGENGACGGCWCMFWHLTRSEFSRDCGQKNKLALKRKVDSGKVPGIILYLDKSPVAWCSVAPREAFSALSRSRVLARVDDQPVWSIVCFFTSKYARGLGLMRKSILYSIEYAARNGAGIMEGYPVDSAGKKSPAEIYMGVDSVFKEVGFIEVSRRSEHHPILRFFIDK